MGQPLIQSLRVKGGRVKRRLQRAREGATLQATDVSQRTVTPQSITPELFAATERLAARLDDSDREAIAAAAEADTTMVDSPVPIGAESEKTLLTDTWRHATGVDRKRMDLTMGTHYGIPSVLEKTGLSAASPPDEVHSMTHSPLGAGGSYYHSDMVVDALAAAGAPLSDGDRLLDFGCSSGRVIRTIKAAYPEVECFGCDPNGPAIEWAKDNLKGIEFRTSDNEPPLQFEGNFFSAAFGISIWSHYNAELALRWYDEMWRVLKPGGHLISTTHGFQSIAFYGEVGLRSLEQLIEIKDALYRRGYWYSPEFGEAGDWGVVNSDWGTSFVSAEWILDRLTPKWQLVEYATARNEHNQDLYVLKKPRVS